MSDPEFDLLRAKLERVLFFVLTDIRGLSLAGAARQVHDLADAAELIPEYLSRREDRDLAAVRGGLQEYAEKYGGMATRLLQILDMDESTFNDLYCRTSWSWPEPSPTAN